MTLVGGNGTAKIGPISAREVWYPETVSVNVNQNPTNEATCQVFTGDANTRRLRDNTFTGSSGDSTSNVGGAIRCGEFVWAVWTGGDSGQVATVTVVGEKEV